MCFRMKTAEYISFMLRKTVVITLRKKKNNEKIGYPVSSYYMAPFNYVTKKANRVGLTCRCYLSNIKPDSIFYDSTG